MLLDKIFEEAGPHALIAMLKVVMDKLYLMELQLRFFRKSVKIFCKVFFYILRSGKNFLGVCCSSETRFVALGQ